MNRTIQILFVGAVLLQVTLVAGCRSLHTNRHTRNLTRARAASLTGVGLLQQQNYSEAGTMFREALNHSEADDRAHRGNAEVLWYEGQWDLAIKHMTLAAELSGQNPDLLVRLGEMHHHQGGFEEAYRQAEAALEIDRRHASAWALRGLVLRQGERLEEAMDSYHRALIHDPANEKAQIAIADIYLAMGRSQRALATIDEMADRTPTATISAEAWLLKGKALAALGETVVAKDCYGQAALCANEDDTGLILELAQLHYEMGDLGQARRSLGLVLANNPNDPNARQFQQTLDQAFLADPNKPISVPLPFVSGPVRQTQSSN